MVGTRTLACAALVLALAGCSGSSSPPSPPTSSTTQHTSHTGSQLTLNALPPIDLQGSVSGGDNGRVRILQNERKAAVVLHRALTAARDELAAGTRDTLQLQTTLQKILTAESRAALDYAEIVDADTFEPITGISRPAYILVAAFLGKTRLIDNLYLEPSAANAEDLTFHL